MRVSLRASVSEGYRMAIKYGTGNACDGSGQIFCHGRSPVMLDVAAGFGVTDTIEIEGRFRFGESSWNGAIPLAAGVGVRLYGDAARFKFVFGVAGFVDFTHYGTTGDANAYRTDVQARLEQGLQYDVHRNVGIYVQLGETIGVLRNFMFTIDGGLGVQVRIP